MDASKDCTQTGCLCLIPVCPYLIVHDTCKAIFSHAQIQGRSRAHPQARKVEVAADPERLVDVERAREGRGCLPGESAQPNPNPTPTQERGNEREAIPKVQVRGGSVRQPCFDDESMLIQC